MTPFWMLVTLDGGKPVLVWSAQLAFFQKVYKVEVLHG